MKNVANPDRHHFASDQRLLMAPIEKKVTSVATVQGRHPLRRRSSRGDS
jgi:hypothetical protein